ncbi:MAG: hypothetical protein CL398_11515 [Acidiferrobacteraceae bacterium]|nr:hypothetical protein [Acidiferrobacteraceae bacterium]|tara:strand:+ start:6624 stop:6845 length:222 start_codon:yes stop_codon:yes gene_type:complete
MVLAILWNEYLYILGNRWITAGNPVDNQLRLQKITYVSLFCTFLDSWPLVSKKVALRFHAIHWFFDDGFAYRD